MGHRTYLWSFICGSLLRLLLLIAHIRLVELIEHRLDIRVHLSRLLLLLLLLLVRVLDLQGEPHKSFSEERIRDQHQTLLCLYEQRGHLLPELGTEEHLS